jgi:hypothetical protein
LTSAGISKPPSATIVTPEAPVNVVYTEQARIVTMPRPPGTQPSAALANRTRRSAVFDAAIT